MSKDEPVTLIAVARVAGVSKTTASDALRDSGRVSERTKQHVIAVARRLGYSPNPAARSLRRASTGVIGLHLPEILTRSEYYMSFVFGVVDEAARHNHDVTLLTSNHLPGSFHRVDGVILGDPLETDPVVRGLIDSSVPVVTCERFTGEGAPAGVVLSDHAAMLEELLDHLVAAGARHVAFLASSTVTDWGRTLQRTYLDWSERHRRRPRLREMAFGSPSTVTQDNVRALLNADPEVDALVCAPDGAAAAVLPVVRAAGRTIGRDLLLASCVDSTALAHTDPPITAIDLRPRDAGSECARLLFDLLSGEAETGTVRTQPIGLVERASTRMA
ncbi:LacI family DNA-binding transcriptional regulator [Amycolatopsis endophytica]|uniref:DNA-binding LacI/PurR family transcriptional regulator n=1 Tax=Amycolatopsis endophytica TaxID=860233 RepID=A0A853AX69_9PSEU|nr:LacI family DNA-binding transcriptional regulator [Amycolatopsis endophytica]NYI87186.1 DNA-binding LacI/PurR family transcriptional regulator [Amycolatopsis endophytica]